MDRTDVLRPLLALAWLLAGGCGYGFVGDDGLWRDDVATIAVAAAGDLSGGDDDLRPMVTAALVGEVEARAPYRVADVERADTLLEVVVRSTDTDIAVRSRRTGFPQFATRTLVADATWTDLRTGEVLLELRGLPADAQRFPTFGEGAPVAGRLASERLAQRVVDEMAARW